MNRDEAELFEKLAKENADTMIGGKLRSASVSITVHRAATGKDEEIGLVSYYHRNPLIHYPMNFFIWVRGNIRLWRQFSQTKVKK